MSYPDKRGIWHNSWAEVNRANREYEQADALNSLAKQAEESNQRARAAEHREYQAQLQEAARRQADEERVKEEARVHSLMQTPEGRAQLAREKQVADFNRIFFIAVGALLILCFISGATQLTPFLLLGSAAIYLLVRFSKTEVGEVLSRAGGRFLIEKASKYAGNSEDADKKYADLVADKATRDTAYLTVLWPREELDQLQNESILGFIVILNGFGKDKASVLGEIQKIFPGEEAIEIERRLVSPPKIIGDFTDEEKALRLITVIEDLGGSCEIKVKRQRKIKPDANKESNNMGDFKEIIKKEILEGLVICTKADRTDLYFSGRLDTIAGHSFRPKLKEIVESSPPSIIVNMKDVTYIGSHLMRSLFEAAREQQRRDAVFRITETSEPIRRVLQLTGMDHLIEPVLDSKQNVKYEVKEGVLRFFLTGTIKDGRMQTLHPELYGISSKHHGDIRFDASDLSDASSALIDLCIDISNSAKASGATFGLEKANSKVKRLFRKAGLGNYLIS